MHVVSGLIGGVGLAFAKRFKPVMIVGTITVLTVSVTFHGMYNLLVSARGVLMYIGFAMPLAVAAVLAPIVKSNKLKSFSE